MTHANTASTKVNLPLGPILLPTLWREYCIAHDPACWCDADRTRVVLAICRDVEQGWSKVTALSEMVGGGFGYHVVFPNLIA